MEVDTAFIVREFGREYADYVFKIEIFIIYFLMFQ